MEVYNSEEQQIEAIKKWWQENSKTIIAGIVLGISAFLGWTFWQTSKMTQAEQASDLYQSLLTSISQGQTESAQKQSQRLIDLYDSTAYGNYGRFFRAKLFADDGDIDGARKSLEEIVTSSSDKQTKHIARLRLIQLHLTPEAAEQGLQWVAEANISESGKFEAFYEELRGDLLLLLDRPVEALSAYQQATTLGNSSAYLRTKRDDLALPPPPSIDENEQ